MRFILTAMLAITIVAPLASCSGSTPLPGLSTVAATPMVSGHTRLGYLPPWSSTVNAISSALPPSQRPAPHALAAYDAASGGIYVTAFDTTTIFGYSQHNKKNRPPICTVPWTVSSEVNDIAVDGTGALIVPDGGTDTIIIGTGPEMCGPKSNTVTDPYGQPGDAASNDASTGTIVVGNVFGVNNAPGNVAVCTVAAGCTTDLTNPTMAEVAGVALDKHGNCWASAAENSSGTPALIYFKQCRGGGVRAKGFLNTSFGGLDIDKSGDLVSVDTFANGTGQLWVYRGCNPNCTVVGGPFPLHGESIFGHLNKAGTAFAAGDFSRIQVDVYAYARTALTYQYSFSKGLNPSADLEGVAYNPRSS